MLHQTRIQHLREVAPNRVVERDGQLYAVPLNGESANEMMDAIATATADWAEANELDPYRRAVNPPLETVRSFPGRFYLDGFKLPKGWRAT